MVTIKSLEDFERFKEFTISPICYVYYKGSLSTNVAYVGFTTQHGYKYLKRHHKMKRIEDVLHQGYSIQIYTKYNENSLIKLFKPSLNQIAGIGICGRTIGRGTLRSVGEIWRKSYGSKSYGSNRFTKAYFRKPIESSYVFAIPIDLVFSIIEKLKPKQDNILSLYQDTVRHLKYKKISIPILSKLFQILRYCKLHCLYLAYVMIHEVYLENLLYHVDMYPNWFERFKHLDQYKKIHVDIVSRLKESQYLTRSILENPTFELNQGPSYYYRLALASLET